MHDVSLFCVSLFWYAFSVWAGKNKERRLPGRTMHRWENNIKMYLKEIH
jgi:hypothetical protein